MNDPVTDFVVGLMEKKARIPAGADLQSFDYFDTGYIDSMELIKFIVQIETKYGIQIGDAEIESSEFKTIGGLVDLIKGKIAATRHD